MSQVSRAIHGFRFGPFELDSDSGELRNNGTPVHLQPQPTQILKILLENHGKLVTREEIQQELWSQQTFVEFEVGLNQAIKKLREAIGDSAQTPIYIETIARKGYRFIAEVQEVEHDGPGDRLLGRVLGHYRMVERIGQGGMGIVYRAYDEHLNRDVAVKILPQGSVADEKSRRRFRKEAMALSKLNHPNIASVYDFDSYNGMDFLVQELITGSGVEQMLANGSLSEERIVALGTQLCEGLSAAHGQGVIHLDLKPANLRVADDGRLKILDFGLATVLHTVHGGSDKAPTESVVESQHTSGTLPYMAPEQLLNGKRDARTDIWGTGCVLYEMATGKLPFSGTGVALADNILHQPPTPPSQLNRKLTPVLEGIILKCLEKDPTLRYASTRDIAVDLHRLSTSTTTRASAAPKRARVRKWALPLIAALVLIVATVVVVMLVTPPKPTATHVIAVIPFRNLTQDPKHDWLVPGLQDMLITGLGEIGGVDIVSPERLMSAENRLKKKQAGTMPSPSEIVQDAGAKAFVSGTLIRISPARIVVEIRLQDVKSGRILYTCKEEGRDDEDLLLMVSKLTNNLGRSLVSRAELPDKPVTIAEITTSNVAALRHYEAGLDYASRFIDDKAVEEFQQAIRMNPQFALAYLQIVRLSWRGDLEEGRKFLAEARRLESRLSPLRQIELEAWESLYVFDYEGAIPHLEAMLRLAPRDSYARLRLASALSSSTSQSKSRLWERGVTILREGITLDPNDAALWNSLAYNEAWAGHEAAAIEACDRLQGLIGLNEPNNWSTRGDVLFQFGRNDEAAAAYEKVRQLDPKFAENQVPRMLATIYADQGKAELAERELQEFKQYVSDASGAWSTWVRFAEAQLLQARGEPELAIPLWHKAITDALREGQFTAAMELMRYFRQSTVALGKIEPELAFVRQLKFKGRELETISFLEAAAGREQASEEALQAFVAAYPNAPVSNLERQRAVNRAMAAIARGDGAAAITALDKHPGMPRPRGLAQLLVKDYAGAEISFRENISLMRSWTVAYLPLMEHLAHFHLGQIYEATNRPADAIREYHSFLSHYTNSHSRLPQIAEARAALKRLGA